MISRYKDYRTYTLPQVAGNEVVGIIEQKEVMQLILKFEIEYSRLPLDKNSGFLLNMQLPTKMQSLVPDYLTDEEAAAAPLTALTIMQSFRTYGEQESENKFSSQE